MRILVAVSGMQHDECADPIETAASLPWPNDTEFCVLAVAESVHPPIAGLVPGGVGVSDVQRIADTAAANVAVSAAARLQDRGLRANSAELEGDPKTKITDFAREWGADLVVVGSCDRPAVERLFVGSVSQSVVNHASCSVLVVKAPHAE